MSCVKNVLGFQVEHHDWNRRVTHTETQSHRGTDMWSRAIPVEQVICRAEYVCRECGAIREEGDCICEPAEAETCPVRLAWLAKRHAQEQSAQQA